MKTTRITSLVIALLMLAITVPTAGAETFKMRIGSVCNVNPLIYYTAIEEGFLAEHGIDVDKQCFSGGAVAITALMAGGVDAVTATYEHVQKLQAQGQDVRAVAGLFNRTGYWLLTPGNSPLTNLEDLKGKSVGITSPGSLSDMLLRHLLIQNGIDPVRDVTIVGAGSGATMLAAIEHSRVAAGMVNQPSRAEAGDKLRVLYDPNTQEYAGIVLVMRGDYIERNREHIEQLLAGIYEARQAVAVDPSIALSGLIKTFPETDAQILERVVEDYLPYVPLDLRISREAAQNVIESLKTVGAIDEEVPYEQAIDLSMLPQ